MRASGAAGPGRGRDGRAHSQRLDLAGRRGRPNPLLGGGRRRAADRALHQGAAHAAR